MRSVYEWCNLQMMPVLWKCFAFLQCSNDSVHFATCFFLISLVKPRNAYCGSQGSKAGRAAWGLPAKSNIGVRNLFVPYYTRVT